MTIKYLPTLVIRQYALGQKAYSLQAPIQWENRWKSMEKLEKLTQNYENH